MDKESVLDSLLLYFREEMPQFSDIVPAAYTLSSKRVALRSLLNLRRPGHIPEHILQSLDCLLDEEVQERRMVNVFSLPATNIEKIGLFVGDIIELNVDAVVVPASPNLLGCFVPGHKCIENKIHSCAGPRLRESCDKIIKKIGHEISPGYCCITYGYHLISKYVIHAVGPSFRTRPSTLEKNELKNCYKRALSLCMKYDIKTIAFPPISVGLNGFTSGGAASIALEAVQEFQNDNGNAPIVVFCVENESDINAYKHLLEE